jgi:ribosome-associated protein
MTPPRPFGTWLLNPAEVELTAIRAQGAGGQNVNKVSSAIHLRFNIAASSLPDAVKTRLLARRDQRLTDAGELVIKAQQHRSQELNRAAALTRLNELIAACWPEPLQRKPTRPTRASQQRRRQAKTQRADLKLTRAKVGA